MPLALLLFGAPIVSERLGGDPGGVLLILRSD